MTVLPYWASRKSEPRFILVYLQESALLNTHTPWERCQHVACTSKCNIVCDTAHDMNLDRRLDEQREFFWSLIVKIYAQTYEWCPSLAYSSTVFVFATFMMVIQVASLRKAGIFSESLWWLLTWVQPRKNTALRKPRHPPDAKLCEKSFQCLGPCFSCEVVTYPLSRPSFFKTPAQNKQLQLLFWSMFWTNLGWRWSTVDLSLQRKACRFRCEGISCDDFTQNVWQVPSGSFPA